MKTFYTDYQSQFDDIEDQYYREQESGLQICPCCGRSVPHAQMTASVSRGVICRDCDLSMPQ